MRPRGPFRPIQGGSDWGVGGGQLCESALVAAGLTQAASMRVTIPPSATAHTKGAWTQVIAATPADWTGLWLTVQSPDITSSRWLMDVGVGASGSEQVLIPDLYVIGDAVAPLDATTQLWLPLTIPAGTRIAARSQSSVASPTDSVRLSLYGTRGGFAWGPPMGSRVAAFGANEATTSGTVLTTGTTATQDLLGAWVQLTAATPYDLRWLGVVCTNAVMSLSDAFGVDVAIGASGSELAIAQRLLFTSVDAANPGVLRGAYTFPVDIPQGTRLAAACMTLDNPSETADVIVYGVG